MSEPSEPDEPGLMMAARLMYWRRRGAELPEAPRSVLLTHQSRLFRALVPRWRGRALPGLSATLRPLGKAVDGLGAVGNLGVGGPATAIAVEELAVLGVRRIVAIDIAAGLDAALSSGSVLLAEAAICADGTSPHYAPGRQRVEARSQLLAFVASALQRQGIEHRRGAVWSTDAPYRETASAVRLYRDQGALAVEMETAALYAASAALGIEAVALLVIADQLYDGWQPPGDMRAVQATLRRLADMARTCLTA